MKCITYISRVVARKNGAAVPTGLSHILRKAQKNNLAFGVTGALSYRSGHYIQVIEGDDEVVDQLFSNIKADRRHEQIEVLIDVEISERAFPEWDMKLLESVNKDPYFISFIKQQSEIVASLPQGQREVLARFFKSSNSTCSQQGFQGKTLKLVAWPDFTIVKPSPVIIELCARLTQQERSYAELLESKDFGTQPQLDKILQKFATLGILKVVQSAATTTQTRQAPKPNSFYSKMKDFLRLG